MHVGLFGLENAVDCKRVHWSAHTMENEVKDTMFQISLKQYYNKLQA